MKRWFRVIIISVFAVAAVSLVLIQFYQTRRTFSINDNMFNVGVSNAMESVIKQLTEETSQTAILPATAFSYHDLDSLIGEELLLNGIDIHPVIGLYDGGQRSFLYCSDAQMEERLEESPYRYSFQPVGVSPAGQLFITLYFPSAELFLQRHSNIYVYMSLVLIFVVAAMFILTLRAFAHQRKLDTMKTEFINNMTHEIKTPISTISLACEMLSDESVAQDSMSRGNFIEIINDENQRMRVLVETMLQSAKMSNKNFKLTPKELDVNEIISRVAASFRLTLANRGGFIETHLEADPSTLFADELHLTNMLYNLVDNGIKYSSGAPHIVVSTQRDGNRFLLKVQDYGVGIAKEDLKHIFDKFYRVSTGNVHDVKGFGIGLNYVASVVRLHHAHIKVESEPGEGSTFTITFTSR